MSIGPTNTIMVQIVPGNHHQGEIKSTSCAALLGQGATSMGGEALKLQYSILIVQLTPNSTTDPVFTTLNFQDLRRPIR